jgi:selenoprotein W-related protein
MAELLKSKYEDKLEVVDLVPSSGGAFEVSIDGDLIYSKLKTGRFPEEKEITDAIDKAS